MPARRPLQPDERARGARILIRFGLLVLLLAALLVLPSPNDALGVVVFNTLLLSIFAMLVIGITGRGFAFVALSAVGLTVLLPVVILALVALPAEGTMARALQAVYDALTEGDPFAALLLILPSALVALLALWLDHVDFKLPRRRARQQPAP